MSGAISDTSKLDSGMNKLNRTINKVGVGMAAYFSVSAIAGAGRAVIDSLKNYEYFSASLRTLMYGDRKAAEALQGQLVDLAKRTPFSLVDVQEGSKQLLAYGFEAGNITKNMEMLGDVSSGVGAPLSDIVYLYGTLKTQGRAYTKDIMQFTSRGIPIIGQLAKQFKVTEAEVQKLVETGKVGFPQIEQAFRDMTSEGGQFFNMMDEQSKTVGGRLSNLGDSWEQLKVSIGKSQTGIIASTTNWANELISKLGAVIEQSNRMDVAFSKSGKDLDYTMMEKFNNWLFMGSTSNVASMFTGGKGKMEMLDRSLQNMYVKGSSKDLTSAYGAKKNLANFASNFIQSYRDDIAKSKLAGFEGTRKISDLEYGRTMALIKQAQEQIDGNIKLLTTPVNKVSKEAMNSPETPKTAEAKKESKKVGSATEYSGARPQNIIINLDRLGDITLNATNVTEGAEMTKEIFSKQLLEVLNDANLVATR